MTTIPRTVERYIIQIADHAKDQHDFEPYFHSRESARFHVADGMNTNLPMSQMTARCQHLTNLLNQGVIGCWQTVLYEAYKQDFLDNVPFEQNHIFDLPLRVAIATNTSISFGREEEIANWLVEHRNDGLEFTANLNIFVDSLMGAVLSWKAGSGMISSNGEEIRMIRVDGNYTTSHNDVLKIHSAIPPDSSRTQVLFEIDTTASYRIKSATMFAQKTIGTEVSEVSRDIPVDQFTGEGSVYSLTFGVWKTHRDVILTEAGNETADRTFKNLSIEFEKNPSNTG